MTNQTKKNRLGNAGPGGDWRGLDDPLKIRAEVRNCIWRLSDSCHSLSDRCQRIVNNHLSKNQRIVLDDETRFFTLIFYPPPLKNGSHTPTKSLVHLYICMGKKFQAASNIK